MPGPPRPPGVRKLPTLARLATIPGILLVALVVPSLARADDGPIVTDCAPPPPLEKAAATADLVFLGVVTEIADGGRLATVAVKDVWRGDLPPIVRVAGGQDPTNPAEDDRTFEPSAAYLFLPVISGDHLVDSVCSSTTIWSDDLKVLRPANAHGPDPDAALAATPSASAGPLAFLGSFAGPMAIAALVGGGAIGLSFLVARRRGD